MLSYLLMLPLLAGAPTGDTCSTTAATAQKGEKTIVETALAAGQFNTLAAALKAADLVEPLQGKGPFTVFAPTDAAFAALPKGALDNLLKPDNKATLQAILTYHVVPGSYMAEKVVKMPFASSLNGQRVHFKVSDDGVTIDGARIVTTDIQCSNGVIHVIDAVIMPSTKDVVATAVAAGQFRTLAAAIQAAGLVEALQGKGPFTVFAPTDEAFAALPAGTVENLLKPENKEQLAAILKLHVVPGRIYADAAAKGAKVESLQGQKLETMAKDGKVWVNGAEVIQADIETSNGVIHVINKVLLPQ
ncbi:MAG TPA: fasciclin domain-containing protein [Planctomycetota bacterium]|nr:fasciclin domain-containing protein [Planctomycetota bacterium]